MVWQGSYFILLLLLFYFLMPVYGAKKSKANANDFIWNTKYMLSDDVGLLGCVKWRVSPLVRGPSGGGFPLCLPTGTQGGEESPYLGS